VPTETQRVLVVDDDPTVSDVVRRYLERAGYAVTQAGDGPAALALAGEFHPDLVVLDLMLPGLDGLEVYRRLREHDSRAAVIMLTALGEETELLETVWGWHFGDQSTVTVHARRLREKIEPHPAQPRRILTVWGVGYRYEPGGADA
jgi:DNA-binding response OmpR family regulator